MRRVFTRLALICALAAALALPATGGAQSGRGGPDSFDNGGFEDGHDGWPATQRLIFTGAELQVPAHDGDRMALLFAYPDAYDVVLQAFRLPEDTDSLDLEFFAFIVSEEGTGSAFDKVTVTLQDGRTHETIDTLVTLSNQDANTGWELFDGSADNLDEWAGEWVRLVFNTTGDGSLLTFFLVDDVSVQTFSGDRGEQPPAVPAVEPLDVSVEDLSGIDLPDGVPMYAGGAGAAPDPGARDRAAAGEQRLADLGPVLRTDPATGVVNSMRGEVEAGAFGGGGLSAEDAALAFLREYGDAFGLNDADAELRLVRTTTARGDSFVRFQQVRNGADVVAHELMVQIGAGNSVLGVLGQILPGISAPQRASLDPADAIASAERAAGVQGAATSSVGDLIIYSRDGMTSNLAYRVITTPDREIARWETYVDAITGDVLARLDQIKSARDRLTYDASDTCDWKGLPGDLVRTEASSNSGDAPLDAAHNFAGDVYDFYFDTFGRDSLDDNGMSLISSVHLPDPDDCLGYNNAHWTGEQMLYGDGDGVTFGPLSQSLDVVAHELTHGFTQYTSDLIYEFQSGALNESMSDVWSMFLDPDPQLAEDVTTPGIAGDSLRNLEEPWRGLSPQPTTWYEFIVLPVEVDGGGVHTNSGITNNIAWQTFGFLGLEQTAQVYYDAQVNRLTSGSSFLDARDALVGAAADIYGDNVAETVAQIWQEHGIGGPYIPPVEDPVVEAGASLYNLGTNESVQIDLFASDLPDVCEGQQISLGVYESQRARGGALVSTDATVSGGAADVEVTYPSSAGTGTRYPGASGACLDEAVFGDAFIVTGGKALEVDLFEGWNPLPDWPGDDLEGAGITDYFDANIQGGWEAIAHYNGTLWEQRFQDPPLPSFNTMQELENGDDIWIFVNSDAVLTIPGAGAVRAD